MSRVEVYMWLFLVVAMGSVIFVALKTKSWIPPIFVAACWLGLGYMTGVVR